MSSGRTFVLLLSLGALAHPAFAQKRLSASEAKNHVGETAQCVAK